jgi:hypothetical protein
MRLDPPMKEPLMTYLSMGAVQADVVFVEQACGLRGRSQSARKAAMHAEIFSLLTDMVDDPLLAPLLTAYAAHVREVMLEVGRAADGITVSSRRRLLADLRAGVGDAAALEMESHPRSLLYRRRLPRPGSQVMAGEAPL